MVLSRFGKLGWLIRGTANGLLVGSIVSCRVAEFPDPQAGYFYFRL